MDTIRDPGKFEGELSIVPKLWDMALEGLGCDVIVGDETFSFVTVYAVTQEPVTDEHYGAMLWEDANGFVYARWYRSDTEYQAAIVLLEQEAERVSDYGTF